MRVRLVAAGLTLIVALMAIVGAAGARPARKTARRPPAGHQVRHGCRHQRRRPPHCARPRRHAVAPGRLPQSPRPPVQPAPQSSPLNVPSVQLPNPTVSAPPPAVAPPARLQVRASEYTMTFSHPTLQAGAAIVEFQDAGQDPHDLHVRAAGGGDDLFAFPLTQPGDRPTDRSVALAPGQYVFYCSLPNHEALGMRALLTVR